MSGYLVGGGGLPCLPHAFKVQTDHRALQWLDRRMSGYSVGGGWLPCLPHGLIFQGANGPLNFATDGLLLV